MWLFFQRGFTPEGWLWKKLVESYFSRSGNSQLYGVSHLQTLIKYKWEENRVVSKTTQFVAFSHFIDRLFIFYSLLTSSGVPMFLSTNMAVKLDGWSTCLADGAEVRLDQETVARRGVLPTPSHGSWWSTCDISMENLQWMCALLDVCMLGSAMCHTVL